MFIVSKVIDGDTLKLANGKLVRLLQVDAPQRGSECYGREAWLLLDALVSYARVRVEFEPRFGRRDARGRWLAYVFKGPYNVNQTLVQRGAAAPWFFRGKRGRYAIFLLRSARNAKTATRGLWKACGSTVLRPTRSLIAIAPPPPPPPPLPPPPPPPPPPTTEEQGSCDPNYSGCLNPYASDYDCAGGSGNGPYYTGPVEVIGSDPYDLDRDGDGYGCED